MWKELFYHINLNKLINNSFGNTRKLINEWIRQQCINTNTTKIPHSSSGNIFYNQTYIKKSAIHPFYNSKFRYFNPHYKEAKPDVGIAAARIASEAEKVNSQGRSQNSLVHSRSEDHWPSSRWARRRGSWVYIVARTGKAQQLLNSASPKMKVLVSYSILRFCYSEFSFQPNSFDIYPVLMLRLGCSSFSFQISNRYIIWTYFLYIC